jgi:hypothetical protein
LVTALTATALAPATGCTPTSPPRQLDLEKVWVSPDARVRTDTVGEGQFASRSTFVLVEAENRAGEAAYVTLGGTFRDAAGEVVGTLNPESLWVPAGQRRLFALVDKERAPRPQARGAQILVYGARVAPAPPIMRLTEERSFDDFGKQIVQAKLTNDADRPGRAVLMGAFFDGQGLPMTRPFVIVPIAARATLPVQLVGPPGSRRGALYLGDLVY